jgi:hypothetical protein
MRYSKLEYSKMKYAFLGTALALGTALVLAGTVAGQEGGAPAPAQQGRGGGRGAGRGRGPAEPAGPMPRLPDGHPDMQGFWTPPAITDIEPAKGRGGAPPPRPPARGGAAAEVGNTGFGFFGGKRIVDPEDGMIPYKPEARAKQQDILAHHMAEEPELHCYQSGVPHSESNQFGTQILQTPGYFVQLSEFMHTVRIIPTDGRPHIDAKYHLFQGDPVGHWEGDTLVVDTTNQNEKTWFDTSGNFKTLALHVTEKFIPQDRNTIVYEATITDPTIYTRPWTVRWNITRNRQEKMSDGHPYEQMEYGCIEGNEDLQHYTKDKGGKAEDKR